MKPDLLALLHRNPMAAAGAALLALLLACVLAAPLIAPAAPAAFDLLHRLSPPSASHPFGADLFGRDVLSRVLFGGRYTLAIGVGVLLIAFAMGTTAGILAGFFGGALDMAIMRTVDAMLSFPALILAIALAAAFGPSLINAMMAIAITVAPQFARISRAQALQISGLLYVEAATAMGVSTPRILFAYILRNSLGPLVTQAPLSIGNAILQTASLGFLGLGAQPPTPEWGADIATNLDYIRVAPWVAAGPGVAILLTVLSFNLIGDSIAQSLKPGARNAGTGGPLAT
jgi:peptide/nickel transport system permease protein